MRPPSHPAHGDAGNHELMICIEGHVMRLNQAILHFQGGGTQTMRISERIADGGCSGGHAFTAAITRSRART